MIGRALAQNMQSIADLGRAQFAQITVQILDQMRDTGAVQRAQCGGYFVFMAVVMIVIMVMMVVMIVTGMSMAVAMFVVVVVVMVMVESGDRPR